MTIYNKLVRDNIPEHLVSLGISATTKILNQQDFENELLKKLAEELAELALADTREKNIEEIADVIEVIRAIQTKHSQSQIKLIRAAYEKIELSLKANSIKWEEVTLARDDKRSRKGAFEQRIFLIGTDE